MKKIMLFTTIAFSMLVGGCNKKDDIVSSETNVGNSTVTYFVNLSLNGSSTITLIKGGVFADPGATATENGKSVTVLVTGSVDVNTPGIYQLDYTAKNKDGFAKSVSRIVVVTPAAEIPGTDLSGQYSGPAGLVANVSKIGDGVYYMDNCNHPLTAFSAYFVSTDGLAIKFYPQATGFGEMYSTSGTYTPATKKAVWTLTIPSQSYTRTRTFTRL